MIQEYIEICGAHENNLQDVAHSPNIASQFIKETSLEDIFFPEIAEFVTKITKKPKVQVINIFQNLEFELESGKSYMLSIEYILDQGYQFNSLGLVNIFEKSVFIANKTPFELDENPGGLICVAVALRRMGYKISDEELSEYRVLVSRRFKNQMKQGDVVGHAMGINVQDDSLIIQDQWGKVQLSKQEFKDFILIQNNLNQSWPQILDFV